ncbi:MAG: hypothetical protein AAGI66_08005 [Cyanobacteria bacterium P01_H01_bin.74]
MSGVNFGNGNPNKRPLGQNNSQTGPANKKIKTAASTNAASPSANQTAKENIGPKPPSLEKDTFVPAGTKGTEAAAALKKALLVKQSQIDALKETGTLGTIPSEKTFKDIAQIAKKEFGASDKLANQIAQAVLLRQQGEPEIVGG